MSSPIRISWRPLPPEILGIVPQFLDTITLKIKAVDNSGQ